MQMQVSETTIHFEDILHSRVPYHALNEAHMIVLQIEHKIPTYEAWKKAFDSDPINRKKSGVISYEVFRPVGDSNYVVIDLAFENLKDAESAHAALRVLWGQVEGKVMTGPQSRMLERVESKTV
jgi:hypothetical protein